MQKSTIYEGYRTGISGHAIRNYTTTITDEERKNIKKLLGCPINKRSTIKMSRASFRIACLRFQKHAGITSRRKKKVTASRLTKIGWVSNNKSICIGCPIGNKVRNNKKFNPPDKIEFVDLRPVGTKKKKKAPKHQSTQKLSEDDVRRIRRMHQEGYSITGILVIFNNVSRSAISNVVNRVTWKHI